MRNENTWVPCYHCTRYARGPSLMHYQGSLIPCDVCGGSGFIDHVRDERGRFSTVALLAARDAK